MQAPEMGIILIATLTLWSHIFQDNPSSCHTSLQPALRDQTKQGMGKGLHRKEFDHFSRSKLHTLYNMFCFITST